MAAPEERLLEIRIELERLTTTREMMIVANVAIPGKYRERDFKMLGKRYVNLQERLISLMRLGD